MIAYVLMAFFAGFLFGALCVLLIGCCAVAHDADEQSDRIMAELDAMKVGGE